MIIKPKKGELAFFPGVYYLRCVNGRHYIGCSNKVLRRISSHIYALSLGKHANKALQADWNEMGAEAFVFGVLKYYETREEARNAECEILYSRILFGKEVRLYNHNN